MNKNCEKIILLDPGYPDLMAHDDIYMDRIISSNSPQSK